MSPSAKSRWERWRGKWVSFWPFPEEYDAGGYRSCTVYLGQVVGIHETGISEMGKIPYALLTIRGRTGREMQIDSLRNNCHVHPNYEEALKRQNKDYETE